MPPPEAQDKVAFIINNIAVANLEAKAREMHETLRDEAYYVWFAQYLVMKRSVLSTWCLVPCWLCLVGCALWLVAFVL